MARRWDDSAAASFVDAWTDAYDPYLDGRARQAWGGGETPERGYAARP